MAGRWHCGETAEWAAECAYVTDGRTRWRWNALSLDPPINVAA
jgi:hypothetical protein